MTLTDLIHDTNSHEIDQSVLLAGNSLKAIVSEAEKQNRLVNGIHGCAVYLQHCPDTVMVCILSDYGPDEDVTISIEHKLIEAFCMENDIKVIKVDSSKKIQKFMSTIQKNSSKYQDRSGDYTCLLIKNSTMANDKTKDTLLKFDKLHHVWGWHVIEFPV